MDLSDQLQAEATFTLDGIEYSGKLEISRDRGIQITGVSPLLGNVKELSSLPVMTEKNNVTIHNVEFYSNSFVSAEYATITPLGRQSPAETTCLEVTFNNLATWVQADHTKYHENSMELACSQNLQEGLVRIANTQYSYCLSIEIDHAKTSRSEESYRYDYKVHFSLKSDDDSILPDKALFITRKLRLLFTIFTGYGIELKDIEYTNKGEKPRSLFYLAAAKNKRNQPEPGRFLIDYNSLIFLADFEKMLNGFFSSEYPEGWNRLHGVIDYQGFWEYEFISVFTLLESHISNKLGKIKHKDWKKDHVFREEVRGILENNGTFEEITSSIKEAQSRITKVTITEKFQLLLSKLPQNVVDYFDFDEKEFHDLKKLRDAISHGVYEKLDRLAEEKHLHSTKSKLTLFLIYCALSDMGIPSVELLKLIHCSSQRSFHPITRNSNVCKRIVDVEHYDAIHIESADTSYSEHIGSLPVYVAFDFDGENYSLNQEFTKLARDGVFSRNDKTKDLTEFLTSNLAQGQAITLQNKIYLSLPNKEYELTCCYIITESTESEPGNA